MSDSNSLVERAVDYIHSNLRATLSVKEIGEALKSHPADIERAFRRANGKTIKRYIDARCKEKVENRLRVGNCKGYEIGSEIGFRSDLAFYRWIKRVYGFTFKQLQQRFRSQQFSGGVRKKSPLRDRFTVHRPPTILTKKLHQEGAPRICTKK